MKVGLLWNTTAFSRHFSIADADSIIKNTGNNTGNMAYVEGILSLLQEDSYTFVPWHADRDQIRAVADILILPAANQLGPHTDLGDLADRFSSWDLPVVVLGLGAQFKDTSNDVVLTEGTKKWLSTLVRLAPKAGIPNIVTRGDFTLTVLDKLGHQGVGVSGGCPSQFINLTPNLGEQLNQKVRNSDFYSLAYNSSHHSWGWAKHIDLAGRDYMMHNSGAYQVQAPPDMISWARETDYFNIVSNYHVTRNFLGDDMTEDEFYRFTRRHACTFGTVPSWREWLTNYDFSLGTRIHGAMLSLQSLVPSLLITHDTRTEEMANKMAVPHIHIKDLDATGPELIKLVKKTLKEHDYTTIDATRAANAEIYLKLLKENGLPVSSSFEAFAASAAVHQERKQTKPKVATSGEISGMIPPQSRVFEVGAKGSCLSFDKKTVRARFCTISEARDVDVSGKEFDYFVSATGMDQLQMIPRNICYTMSAAKVCVFKFSDEFVASQKPQLEDGNDDGLPIDQLFAWMKSVGLVQKASYKNWKFKNHSPSPSIYVFNRLVDDLSK